MKREKQSRTHGAQSATEAVSGKPTESEHDRLLRLANRRLRYADPRPDSIDGIFGQNEALEKIVSSLCSEARPHLLLNGPAGVGKTTVARAAFQCARQRGAFDEDAPFIEVDATTLSRDDSHNLSPLTSSVLEGYYGNVHDRQEEKGLSGLPEIYFGSCAKAHLGVQFLDEIGELAPWQINQLLKVLEDGKETLTSRTFDPSDARAPVWMRSFFAHGVPADFVLIAATTRAIDELPPALVSRCEVVQFRALDIPDRESIAKQAAIKIGSAITDDAARAIAESTSSGRETSRRVVIAHARATARGADIIERVDVPGAAPVVQLAELSEVQLLAEATPLRAMIAELASVLGHQALALLCGVRETHVVRAWRDGRQAPPTHIERVLRTALTASRIIGAHSWSARRWFWEPNLWLARSPLDVLRTGGEDPRQRSLVVAAAKNLVDDLQF